MLAFVHSFHHSDKTPEMIHLMKGIFLVARGFRDLFGLSLLGSVTVAQFIGQKGVTEVSVHLAVATKQRESGIQYPCQRYLLRTSLISTRPHCPQQLRSP